MIGVHTNSITTQMIERETRRDRADEQFVSEAMGDNIAPTPCVKEAVATIGAAIGSPVPAVGGLFDLGPKPLGSGWALIYSFWHRSILSVSVRRAAHTVPSLLFYQMDTY